MNDFLHRIVILALLIVCAILFNRSCETQKKYERVASALTIADLSNQKFESKINKQGEEIAIQNQLILSKDEALENNILELEELKKYKNIKSKTTIETITKTDTVFVPYVKNVSDTVISNVPNNFFQYFNYQEKDNWYSFSGKVSDIGVTMYEMDIKNKYSILIADKKLGLFKKPRPEILLTNENPYTSTISMNNVQVVYDVPFYKKEWFWFVLGSATTIYITK